MSKYREVFEVLQSTEYAAASNGLAALLGARPAMRSEAGAAISGDAGRSFLDEVGLDGWATDDRYANGYYSMAG